MDKEDLAATLHMLLHAYPDQHFILVVGKYNETTNRTEIQYGSTMGKTSTKEIVEKLNKRLHA